MALDGTVCQQCGEWMDGGSDGPGFPQTCLGCRRSGAPRREVALRSNKKDPAKKIKCGQCLKSFTTPEARLQHIKDKHHISPSPVSTGDRR